MNTLKTLTKLSLVAAGATMFSLATTEIAQAAGFTGDYDVSNWTLTNINANGSVDTSGAPLTITTTGGDNGSGLSGQTSYTTTAVKKSLISFNWNYFTTDGPFWDRFGFLLNGVFTELTNLSGSTNQIGNFSTLVNQGETFGFAINTVDNIFSPGNVTISNFDATPVPEPVSMLGLLTVGGLGLGSLKRKQKA